MTATLSEKIKKILISKRKDIRRKSIISVIASLSVTVTALIFSLPAMTSTADELQKNGTVYSSNLADFVTQVIIRDMDGNVIDQNGTVYIGENYEISICFSENNISGQEKQFVYNNDGYLTYQIPEFFLCAQVENGTITDPNDEIVGSYSIDESGLLKVRFIDGYIDSTKATMTITFSTTASGVHGSGTEPIDFGYIIDVNVVADGTLNVKKTAGEYDPRSHSVPYQIRVEAKNGTIYNISYSDTFATPGITIDPATIVYTSLDGSETYNTMPNTLHSNEGFIIKYNAVLDKSVYEGKNEVSLKAKNSVTFTGMGEDGIITATDTAEKKISTKFLAKSGKDEPSNSRIKWTVTVGDGSTVVDGLKITDIPGTGLSFDLAKGINASVWSYSQDGLLIEVEKFNMPFSSNPSTITLPSNKGAYSYVLTYYTNYELESGVTSQQFSNTISASDSLHGKIEVTGNATGHSSGAPPEITKTVEKNTDAPTLHYKIEIEVPAYYAGTSGFYLYDTYTKAIYADTEYFFGNEIENLSIYTVNSSNFTRTYIPYTSGATEYTYLRKQSTNPRSTYIYFNSDSTESNVSRWLETEDVTLYIEYNLPLDSDVYIRPDGENYVLSDGLTVRELISLGLPIKNTGRIYFNNKLQYKESEAVYKESSSSMFFKTGSEIKDGIIEYSVVFNNYDSQSNTILQKKMKELIFHDTLCTVGMSYVDDSLFCDIYNDDLSRIRFTYKYSEPISGSTSINASARDFIWYSGDNTSHQTLYSYAQTSGIGGSSSSTARIIFRYKVLVDKTTALFNTTEQTLPMTNTARMTGIMPDNTTFDTGEYECIVPCCTNIVKKDVEHTEGSNRADFTIILNPAGADLLNGVTQMTVIDRMTDNLKPVLNSIKVYQKIGNDWVEFEARYNYNTDENALSFILPDDVALKITYTTIITEIGDNVSIGNCVELQGYAEYSAVINTEFKVIESGGAASAENFRFSLLKQSSETHCSLEGAVFALYGPQHSERQGVPPANTEPTITLGNTTLWYYTTYATDINGTVLIEKNENGIALFSVQGLYALKEITAPDGYHLSSNPVFFYAEEKPENAISGIEVLSSDMPFIISNEPYTYQLPSTGGNGIYTVYPVGAMLLLLSVFGLFLRTRLYHPL